MMEGEEINLLGKNSGLSERIVSRESIFTEWLEKNEGRENKNYSYKTSEKNLNSMCWKWKLQWNDLGNWTTYSN